MLEKSVSPIVYPRTENDSMAELGTDAGTFVQQLADEQNLVGLAMYEIAQDRLSSRTEPYYGRTTADEAAEKASEQVFNRRQR